MEAYISLTAILSSLRRRWWLVLLCLILGAAGSTWFGRRLPKIYRASTLILVIPQKIPVAYVRPTVTASIEDRLRSLRQQITSRSRLERVIKDLNLFPNRFGKVPTERLVASMIRRLRLEMRGTSTFRIWYEGPDRVQAADVANKVAEIFIQENTSARLLQARNTTEFLDTQMERMKEQLEEHEARIARFKQQHMGELPEQRESNLRTLEALQGRLRTNSEGLTRARDRRLTLESQLDGMPSAAADVNQVARQLEQEQARLQDLLTRYTESHPDVIQLRREIANLERSLQQPPDTEQQVQPRTTISPYHARLKAELDTVGNEIRTLEAEQEQLRVDVAKYQARVENAPRNEALLSQLTRDNDNLRLNYRSLLNKKIEAELAEQLEEKTQGEIFTIVDRALPPSLHYKPNMTQITSIGTAGGLLAGCILAILFDLLRPRFRTETELVGAYGIPVLATIPFVTTETMRRKHRVMFRVLLGSSLAVVVLGAILIVLWTARQ